MAQDERILELFQTRIAQASGNPNVKIEGPLRIGFSSWDVDNKSTASISFRLKDEQHENDPLAVHRYITKAAGTIDALKSYLKLETETNHMARLANELTFFIQKEADLNAKDTGQRFSTIPRNASEWFKELPKRKDWNIKHAWTIEKKNTGVISLESSVPNDIDPATIVKNIEEHKTAILEMLANRAAKYAPETDKEAVKKLHMVISAEEKDGRKKVIVQLLSDLQLQASQAPSGFDPNRMAEYVESNPLTKLQNGESATDGILSSSEHPAPIAQPHLQKAIARAFLFAGEKANDIFPLIAGKEDMARAVGKSLTLLKKRANDPELTKKIDAFLADEVFKDRDQWGKPIEEQKDLPESIRIIKDNGTFGAPKNAYEKGIMDVVIPLPGDKLPEIMEKLAAIDPKASVESNAPQLSILADTITQLSEKVGTLVNVIMGKAPPILQMLVDKKALTPEQQQEALSYSKQHNILSGQAAVMLGGVTQDMVDKTLREQALLNGTPHLASPAAEPDCGCKEKTPENIAQAIIAKVTQGQDWAQKAEASKGSKILGL